MREKRLELLRTAPGRPPTSSSSRFAFGAAGGLRGGVDTHEAESALR